MDSNPGGPPPLQFDTAVPRVTPSEGVSHQRSRARCVSAESPRILRRQRAVGLRLVPRAAGPVAETPRSWGVFAEPARSASARPSPGRLALLRRHRDHQLRDRPRRDCDRLHGGVDRSQGRRRPRRTTIPGAGDRVDVLGRGSGLHAAGVPAAGEGREAEPAQASTPTPRSPPRHADPDDGDDRAGHSAVLAILLGFSFALPVLVIVGSLPGGLISARDHRLRHAAGVADDRRRRAR